MMRDLTTADIAFLLCTSKGGSYRFSLSTNYGLVLDVGASDTITASLERPGEARPDSPSGRLRSIAPPSPICTTPRGTSIDTVLLTPTSTVAPGFPQSSFSLSTNSQSQRTRQSTRNSSSTTTATTTPSQRNTSTSKPHKPAKIITAHLTSPSPPPLSISQTTKQSGYKYLITPSYNYYTPTPQSPIKPTTHRRSNSSTSSSPSPSHPRPTLLTASTTSYIFYASNWPSNPRSPTLSSLSTGGQPQPLYEKLVREEDLESRYRADWFQAYLDWVNRSQRAVRRMRRRAERRGEMDVGGRQPFGDEGERTLWMVEGLLLAGWLCLQGDCAEVEYAPFGVGGCGDGYREGEVYLLEEGNVGRVIEEVLGRVRT